MLSERLAENLKQLEPYMPTIKSKVTFVLKKYPNNTLNEQYYLFLSLVDNLDVDIEIFVQLKKEIENAFNFHYNEEDIDLQYHIEKGMTDTHMRIFNSMNTQYQKYEQLWRIESLRDHPDKDELERLSNLMLGIAKVISDYLLGVPVLYFVKYNINAKQNKTKGLPISSIKDINKYIKGLGLNNSNTNATNSGTETTDGAGQNGTVVRNDGHDNKDDVRERPENVPGGITETKEIKSRREKEAVF